MDPLFVLHLLAAVVWTGGLFFAYVIVRPTLQGVAAPAERMKLWLELFRRFFPWVWAALITALGSGFWMVLGGLGGFGNLRPAIHVMSATGSLMALLFTYLYFSPYPRLQRAVAEEEYSIAAQQLGTIRRIVAINTLLGLATVVVAAAARYG